MRIRHRGKLRQMRHAQHLLAPRDAREFLRHALCGAAGHAGVHLIENHGHHTLLLGEHVFQCQHDTCQLAAGGDAVDGLERFAHVGRHQEAHRVDAAGIGLFFGKVDGKAHLGHVQLPQLAQNALLQHAGLRAPRFGKHMRRVHRRARLLGELSLQLRNAVVRILDAVQLVPAAVQIGQHLLH